jgi:hypothetical protein
MRRVTRIDQSCIDPSCTVLSPDTAVNSVAGAGGADKRFNFAAERRELVKR